MTPMTPHVLYKARTL